MDGEKSYLNKDLIGSEEAFNESITNDFIGEDFIEQLEWSMLITQGKFKQIRFADYLPPVTVSHFDKAFLLSTAMNDKQRFPVPFTDLQASPALFPLVNIKIMLIGETVVLTKTKEIPPEQKRNLRIKRKHAYERSVAFYKKDTESFYGMKEGFEVNPSFFSISAEKELTLNDLPSPISLHPNYYLPPNPVKYLDSETLAETIKNIAMAYQIAFSMYYEWCIYLKEYDNIGFIIPIDPSILSEIYKTSMLKFDNKKRMLHFVMDHYRRKKALANEDYSVYVNKYLRGEHKFDYRNFYTEIIPPRYDLNRAKTKKKFVDPLT